MTDIKRRACVLGDPVTQSLSPVLHNYWLAKYGIQGDYGAIATTASDLKKTLAQLADQGYAGCNLTMPLKETARDLMDDLDESSIAAGAVNTVVFDQGRARGFNSDGFGFLESLKAQAPAVVYDRIVILGTGGAARGIVAALKGVGAKSFALINRTAEKAGMLKAQLVQDADIFSWDQRVQALDGASLLVNCTSLGMVEKPPLELALDQLPPAATVADIVYRPNLTPLLQAAAHRGHAVATGLPMLLHQGRVGFKHWFGRDPVVDDDLYIHMTAALEGRTT